MKRHLFAALVGVALLASAGCSNPPEGPPAGSTSTVPSASPVATASSGQTPKVSTPTTKPGNPTTTPAKTPTAVPSPSPKPVLGNRLLFARGDDIWAIDQGTGKADPIIQSGRHFSWSPDGQRIVFVRGKGKEAEIWIANGDGSGQIRLTHDDREDIWPMWSPNGQAISFTSSPAQLSEVGPWQWQCPSEDTVAGGVDEWARSAEVWLINADGSNPRRLAAGFGATWAPEGRRLAFHRRQNDQKAEIMIINSEGRNEWRLAESTPLEGPVSGGLFYGQPAWSTNGQDLVYGVASYAMLSDWGLLRRAATLSHASMATIGQTEGYFARIVHSPDGHLLATDFYGSSGRGPTDGLAVFWLGQPSSSNFYNEPIQLAATKVLNVQGAHSPAFSPDGQELAYVAGNSVWVWNRSTQQVVRLVQDADINAGLSWGGH